MGKERGRQLLRGGLTVLLLSALLLWVFHDHTGELLAAIRNLSVWEVLLLPVLAVFYECLEAQALRQSVREDLPELTTGQALEMAYLGEFAKVCTLGAGIVPMQSIYLKHCGLETGKGMGLLISKTAFYKSCIILISGLVLMVQGQWLSGKMPWLRPLALTAILICFLILSGLFLLCTWSGAHRSALWVLEKLPEQGKWQERKERWQKQADLLYYDTRAALGRRVVVERIIGSQLLRLLGLCMILFVCSGMSGNAVLTFFQTSSLLVLMLLLSSVIPNLAGMGSIELTFLLLFGTFEGLETALAVLLIYRITTYYLPFLLSIPMMLSLENRLLELRGQAEE